MIDPHAFGKWLLKKIEEKELSQSDLARKAKVTRSTISGVVTGRRQPGARLMIAIAEALKIPPNEVFEAAGILPPTPKSGLDQINYLLTLLSKEEQDEVASYITYRLETKKKGHHGDHNKVVGLVETESV